jgi:hypothetical protein
VNTIVSTALGELADLMPMTSAIQDASAQLSKESHHAGLTEWRLNSCSSKRSGGESVSKPLAALLGLPYEEFSKRFAWTQPSRRGSSPRARRRGRGPPSGPAASPLSSPVTPHLGFTARYVTRIAERLSETDERVSALQMASAGDKAEDGEIGDTRPGSTTRPSYPRASSRSS